jgi:hypothetical protein
MPLVLAGATSGATTLQSTDGATQTITLPNNTGTVVTDTATQTLTNKTLTSPAIDGTPTGVGVLTSGTSVSASGTSVDFTSIPLWVKRITVMFSGVSLSGSSDLLIQVGDSGGFETSDYLSTSSASSSGGTAISNSTAGFVIRSASAASITSGVMALVTLGSNLWVSSYSGKQSSTVAVVNGGNKTLSDTLTQVRITTVNGTDTFDAGTINILFE